MKDKVIINDIAYSLSELEADIWNLLLNGSQKAKDGFHTGVIANQAEYGISLRTVVLRKVIKSSRRLICHTDKRSHKVEEIRNNPKVSWLFYDHSRKIQIRLAGMAQIHEDDELANQIWENSGIGSRKIYVAQDAPATPLPQPSSGLPPGFEGKSLSEEQVAPGRTNFVVLSTTINFVDWLYLNPQGHTRAQFTYQEGAITMNWVSP